MFFGDSFYFVNSSTFAVALLLIPYLCITSRLWPCGLVTLLVWPAKSVLSQSLRLFEQYVHRLSLSILLFLALRFPHLTLYIFVIQVLCSDVLRTLH